MCALGMMIDLLFEPDAVQLHLSTMLGGVVIQKDISEEITLDQVHTYIIFWLVKRSITSDFNFEYKVLLSLKFIIIHKKAVPMWVLSWWFVLGYHILSEGRQSLFYCNQSFRLQDNFRRSATTRLCNLLWSVACSTNNSSVSYLSPSYNKIPLYNNHLEASITTKLIPVYS